MVRARSRVVRRFAEFGLAKLLGRLLGLQPGNLLGVLGNLLGVVAVGIRVNKDRVVEYTIGHGLTGLGAPALFARAEHKHIRLII